MLDTVSEIKCYNDSVCNPLYDITGYSLSPRGLPNIYSLSLGPSVLPLYLDTHPPLSSFPLSLYLHMPSVSSPFSLLLYFHTPAVVQFSAKLSGSGGEKWIFPL